MSFNFAAPSFGTATTTSTFSFGTPANTAKSAGGGGTVTTSTGFSLGGLSAPTFTPPGGSTGLGNMFGGGFGLSAPSTTSSFTGFQTGATTTTANTGFSFSGFGQTSTPSLLPSVFGQTAANTGLMGQQNQGGMVPGLDPIYNSVFNCCIFGDDRDEVMSKWNLLQACWGTGKGYYAQNMPPVEYTTQNPLCRFKAIVYSMKATTESKEGLVAIQFKHKEENIRTQEAQLITNLTGILGNKPNISIHVDSIKPTSECSCVVFIYVEEKAPNGECRRVGNSELCSYLGQEGPMRQLRQLGAEALFPHSTLEKDQLNHYLETPPAGIDPRLWKQAQLDNPDPNKYMPVPLLGFSQVRWRYHCQIQETKRHQAFLDNLAEEIAKLQRDNEAARLRVLEYRHKMVELEHRLLKVLVRQQVTRNIGVALRPEEEILRSQLETIQSQLNSPQFKGRLSDLLSQIRMHKQEASQEDSDNYTMNPSIQEEIKHFLEMEQLGIKALIDIVQSDMDDIRAMREDVTNLSNTAV